MEKARFIYQKDFILLSVIIFIHVACWFVMKPIYPEGDPLVYFVNAQRILNNEYFFSFSVQSHRYGVFVPQAIFVRLFGEDPYIINLWALLCSSATIFLIYLFLLKFLNRPAAIIAGLLLSVNMIQVIYSSTVFPDMMVAFFGFCSIYFVYKGRTEKNMWLKNSLFFVSSFAFGFSAKESIIVILPFIAFVFWNDWKTKLLFQFHKSTTMLLILFTAFIFAVSKFLTGDFFFFYNSYSHYQVFLPLQNFSELIREIFMNTPLWLNAQLGYVFLFIFSIPAIVKGIANRNRLNCMEGFISVYAIVLFFTLWFGSISFFHLGHIPMVDRRWMIMIVPLCILSAITIHGIIQNTCSGRGFYFLVTAFLLLGLFNIAEYTLIRGMLFFSFALVLMLQEIIRRKYANTMWIRMAMIILPFFILIIEFLRTNSNYL